MTISSQQLVVVYDYGSVPPLRLAEVASANNIDLVFVPSSSPHSRAMLPVLEHCGKVIDGAGRTELELSTILSRARPQGIVTFSETQLDLTSRLAAHLDLPYQATVDMRAIASKEAQRVRLQAAGIECPRHHVVTCVGDIDEAISRVGVPAVVKPLLGASSRNTFLITDRAQGGRDIAAIFDSSKETALLESSVILEEQLIGRSTDWPWGDYVGIDLISNGDTVEPLFVTGKFALADPFRERGGYGPVRMDRAELQEVKELAIQAIRALNIRHGISGVEIKLTDRGPRVIEVNGRLGGWVEDLAMRSRNLSPCEVAFKAALGRPFDIPSDPPHSRIAFHYLLIPPVGAVRIQSMEIPSKLRSISGVERVSVLAEVGGSVDWRHGTASSVAAILGMVDSHDDLAKVVERVEGTNWVEYR